MGAQHNVLEPQQPDAAISQASLPILMGFEAVGALTEASCESGWEAEYRQLGKGKLTASVCAKSIGNVQTIIESCDRSLLVMGSSPEAHLTVLIPMTGTEIKLNGQTVTEEDMFVLPPGREVRTASEPSSGMLNVHIPSDLLRSHFSPSAHDQQLTTQSAHKIHVGRNLSDLRNSIIENTFHASNERMDKEQESSIVSRISRTLEVAKTVDTRTDKYNRLLKRRALNRALEYIDANYARPLRIDELCQYANVSISTLERMFRSELKLTPIAYLRVRRLHAARCALMDPSNNHSIARIAITSGFSHLGRFSSAYRSMFGYLPREAGQQASANQQSPYIISQRI